MNSNSAVIGIDIGGTKISAALFNQDGDILQKENRPLDGRKGQEVIDLIGTMALSLINYSRSTTYKVKALGACVPGIYDPVRKTAWAPNIPGWDQILIWEGLTKHIDDPSIEIVIESDRSCYILGEVWKGGAKGCSDAIFVAIGTGIGAGILSGGRIIQGHRGIAGAIGWMALEPPYDAKYDFWGNFEHYASGNGIARSAVEALSKNRETESVLEAVPIKKITSYEVFKAFEKKDALAIEVIDKAIVYWGMALANLVSIFNPQQVIYGGGVFGPASQFLHRILAEAKKWAQPLSIKEVELKASILGGDAGLIGAGYLALKTLNDSTHDE